MLVSENNNYTTGKNKEWKFTIDIGLLIKNVEPLTNNIKEPWLNKQNGYLNHAQNKEEICPKFS